MRRRQRELDRDPGDPGDRDGCLGPGRRRRHYQRRRHPERRGRRHRCGHLPGVRPRRHDLRDPAGTLATQSKTVDGNGNGTYTSAGYTTTTAGTYRWRAFFAGDANNAAVSGACNAEGESSTTTQVTPAITTQASGPVTVGGTINDVATLSGAVGATGAVTFQVFAPGDTTCATPLATLATSTKSVNSNGNGTYTSAGFTTTTAGTYQWRAFFAGDGNNAAVSGACNAANEGSTVTTTSSPPPSTPSSPAISITKNPKSQIDRDRRDGELHDHRHEHRHPDPDERDRLAIRSRRTATQSSSTIAALASMAPGASRDLQLLARERDGAFTNVATATGTLRGSNVTATDTAPVTVAPLTAAGTPAPSRHPADAEPTPKRAVRADAPFDRDRQGSVLADGGGRRHRDVQDHRHEHR